MDALSNPVRYCLHYGQLKKPVLEIVADGDLYRIRWPDIGLSDLTNLTRAKEAALDWAQHQKMTKGRHLSVAQRLKSLKNFSWSGGYSDLNRPGAPRDPLLSEIQRPMALAT